MGDGREELLTIADDLLSRAAPGEQVEVVVARERETEVTVHANEVESLTVSDSASVGVRVIADNRQGISWAGTFERAAALEALVDARDNARFASPDPNAGLAVPDGRDPPELLSYREGVSATSTDEKVGMALELERQTMAGDRRISGIEAAEYADTDSVAAIASTTGVRSFSRETACWLSVTALASDDGDTQTGFGFSLGRQPRDLDPSVAAAGAAGRAAGMLGAVQPPTGRCTVVLEPWVTAQLLELVGGTLTGDAVQKGRSLFAGRLGQEIAADGVTLLDNPTDPRAFTAASHDDEGLATRRNILISAGSLEQFLHNSYTARVAGTVSTGSAVRGDLRSSPGVGCQALQLIPGLRSTEEIIAELDDAILVRDVFGLHSGVNPVSGDLSTGAEGVRIRHGERAEPLREFTIGSTLQRLLTSVREVGGEQEVLPMAALGSTIVVDDVVVSGG